MANNTHENNTVADERPTPAGLELRGNLSFSRLNPNAGVLARDTKAPQLCGWITGIAYAYRKGEGKYGEFTRILGDFLAIPFNRGTEITGTELFLPGVAERFVCAGIDTGAAVPLRFEGWCFPDDSGRKGGTGYVYRVFVRQPPGALSAARRMAIECGIIDAPMPPPALALEAHDPITGEVGGPAEVAEIGDLEDALNNLVQGGTRKTRERGDAALAE